MARTSCWWRMRSTAAGSPQNSRVLSIEAGARMGLSATPKRFGDAEGTERLLEYFGG